MRRRVLLVCIVAIVGAVVIWAWSGHNDRPAKLQASSNASPAMSVVTTARPAASSSVASISRRPKVAASSGSASTLQRTLVTGYECSNCPDSPFVARSPGEAAWLQSRGFPTQDELQNMDSIDRGKLRAEADQGNLAAMGLYGTILLQEGRQAEGVGYLTKAELSGSVYALYGLSESRMPSHEFADKYSAATYIRLAYLLGDSRAPSYLYRNFAGFDNGEWAKVDRDASMYLRRLIAAQTKKFGAPLSISPRPPTPEANGPNP